MLAKASIAAVQNARNTVVEQQPQVVVNSAIATGGTAVGGVVWMVHDQFKTERQIQSNERFASEEKIFKIFKRRSALSRTSKRKRESSQL